jgi:hypothetical protein
VASRPRRLYHYTCDHSLDKILACGYLRPPPGGVQRKVEHITGFRVIALSVVWLTDIDVANEEDVEVLGLGAHSGLITCDRVEFRFRVPSSAGEWWPEYADRAVAAGQLSATYRADLELEREPKRWWVSTGPIPGVRLDERYRPPRCPRQ